MNTVILTGLLITIVGLLVTLYSIKKQVRALQNICSNYAVKVGNLQNKLLTLEVSNQPPVSDVPSDKLAWSIKKTLENINLCGMTVSELLSFYGNLGYNIGKSIAGLKEDIPTIKLQEFFTKKPSPDLGLMLQGLIICGWADDYKKHPSLSRIAEIIQREGETNGPTRITEEPTSR